MILRDFMMRRGFALIATVVVTLMLAPCDSRAQIQKEASKAAANEMASDRAFLEWLDALRSEARRRGISESTLNAALNDIAPVMRVIELDRNQPEFTQTFWTYLRKQVNDHRIKRGRAMLSKHLDLLNNIHAEYGVPPRYLIALWGLETTFGDYLGSFRVIEALATLAYDQRRAQFFRAELLNALKIVEEGHISPDAMQGSWAGAMGHMQFIPSTFTGHAVDYTGDGRKDIWDSLPDAFASAANFLCNIGWQPEQIWGREVRLPENFNLMLATLDMKKTLAEWSSLGVRRSDWKALPQANMAGSIVLPQGYKGPAFLVYDNFRAILRWNRSINYAISVGYLADRIVELPQIANGRDAEHEPLSLEEAKEMQQLLNLLGFDAGPEDGLLGFHTSSAIRAFQNEHSLPPDGYPSPALLKRLRTLAATIP
jgi:membrane-bound lytic murein transglycosylase B